MILSDHSLHEAIQNGRLHIDPFDAAAIQPSSIDLHLLNSFLIFRNTRRPYLDLRVPQDDLTELVEVSDEEPFILHPREFVLGSTIEALRLPADLVGRLDGKSSLGRCGLLVHSTAGYIDPGFFGRVTLELSNVSSLPMTLYPGMPIAQISFQEMTTPADIPYGDARRRSKYHGQMAPRASEFYREFATEG